MTEKKYVIRSVRLNVDMDTNICKIARHEGRTINNTIQFLLRNAMNDYFEKIITEQQAEKDYEDYIKEYGPFPDTMPDTPCPL